MMSLGALYNKPVNFMSICSPIALSLDANRVTDSWGRSAKPRRMETIGQVLRRHRLRQGLSQRDVEDRIGIQVQVISKIELGTTKAPSVITVGRLCDLLGITVDQALREAGILPPQPADRPATRGDIDELREYVAAALRVRRATRRR